MDRLLEEQTCAERVGRVGWIDEMRALARTAGGRQRIENELREAALSDAESKVLRMRIGLPQAGPPLAKRYPHLADKICEVA